MYKFDRYHQFRLEEFNQPLGMKLDPNNRWVKMADTIPWNMIEDRYAKLLMIMTTIATMTTTVTMAMTTTMTMLTTLTMMTNRKKRIE